MNFYTYTHATPDGDVFYVGKGIGHRVYSMRDRSWLWRDRFNRLDGIIMKIVARFETEQEAFDHERKLIEIYTAQGFNLVNLTEGGEGVRGYKQSPELRRRRSEKMRGYVYESVTCPHCGDTGGKTSMMRWHFDKCTGPSRKFKARVTINGERIEIGRFATKDEARAAVSEYYRANPRKSNWIGRKHSEASKAKMSLAHKGVKGADWSDASRKKLSERRKGADNPFFGRKHSTETKSKISAKGIGRKGYWAGKNFSEDHISKLKTHRTCPHCGKEGSGSAMNRYHMNNCKFRAEAA